MITRLVFGVILVAMATFFAGCRTPSKLLAYDYQTWLAGQPLHVVVHGPHDTIPLQTLSTAGAKDYYPITTALLTPKGSALGFSYTFTNKASVEDTFLFKEQFYSHNLQPIPGLENHASCELKPGESMEGEVRLPNDMDVAACRLVVILFRPAWEGNSQLGTREEAP